MNNTQQNIDLPKKPIHRSSNNIPTPPPPLNDPYALSNSAGLMGDPRISLARLTYSQGSPLLSTLSSLPISCGDLSVSGLCKLVKLVSRHNLLLAGVGPSLQVDGTTRGKGLIGRRTGLEQARRARISCSISISGQSAARA